MDEEKKFGIARVTRFYIPLLLQAFSQSITYPLVGSIVTHGALGVDALTGFAQGLAVMFMIGLLGGGLITTGMVLVRDASGYYAFRRLNGLMMILLLILQLVPTTPAFGTIIFESWLQLPPALANIARETLFYGIVLNAIFFLRNIPLVILLNNLDSKKANNATLIRIFATIACSLTFPSFGLTGPKWGLFAMTLGVFIEFILTWLGARKYTKALKKTGRLPWRSELNDDRAQQRRFILVLTQFKFMLPLSIGSFVLAISPLAMAAFIGRTTFEPSVMLAIHYVTIGVANPVAFAALRLQTVAIAFPPEHKKDYKMLWYSIFAGGCLGLMLLIFSSPIIADEYFGNYQNVKPEHISYARAAIAGYCLWPILQALRARIEGLAAARKRPSAVLGGQLTYLFSLVAILFIMLANDITGWKMAVGGIYFATSCTIIALYLMLAIYREKDEIVYSNPSTSRIE